MAYPEKDQDDELMAADRPAGFLDDPSSVVLPSLANEPWEHQRDPGPGQLGLDDEQTHWDTDITKHEGPHHD